jgi:hypothetical protein
MPSDNIFRLCTLHNIFPSSSPPRYYKATRDAMAQAEPLGSVPLESSKVCLPPADACPGRPHTFCIVTDTMAGGRTLWCSLDTEGARDVCVRVCGGRCPYEFFFFFFFFFFFSLFFFFFVIFREFVFVV